MKGWVGLVGGPTVDGLPTLCGHPSAAGRAQDSESSLVKDRRSTNCAMQPLRNNGIAVYRLLNVPTHHCADTAI